MIQKIVLHILFISLSSFFSCKVLASDKPLYPPQPFSQRAGRIYEWRDYRPPNDPSIWSFMKNSFWPPTQETVESIKDYARLGLLGAAGMMSGWMASTVAGLPAFGLAGYFWISENWAFYNIIASYNALYDKFDPYFVNPPKKQLEENIASLQNMLEKVQSYTKTTWSYSGRLAAPRIESQLQNDLDEQKRRLQENYSEQD